MKLLPYEIAQPCPYPNCKGIKLPFNNIWRCSIGGLYHHFWVRTQIIKALVERTHAMPLEKMTPIARYWENLRRNVIREGIKEMPQEVLR